MWDRLNQADIAQARQEIERRRADMLARHARELDELQTAHADIETLDALIDTFARKFKAPSSGIAETSPATIADVNGGPADAIDTLPDPVPETASLPPQIEPPQVEPHSDPVPVLEEAPAATAATATASPPPRRGIPPEPDSADYPRTNFEAFSRAIKKASF